MRFEFAFDSVDGAFNNTEGAFLDDIVLPCQSVAGLSAGYSLESELELSGQTPRVDQEVIAGEQPPPPDFVPPPMVAVPPAPRGVAEGVPESELDQSDDGLSGGGLSGDSQPEDLDGF